MNEALSTDRHTPGPWRLLKPGSMCIEAPDGNVAVVNLARASDADARLIAAAPDLLAIVCDLAQYAGAMEYDDWRGLVVRAEVAIAKAEGRPCPVCNTRDSHHGFGCPV